MTTSDVYFAPATFSQRRLALIHDLDSKSSAYHICAGIQINGDLNVDALTSSLNEIIRRHEPLRTTFHMEKGEIWQQINPFQPLNLIVETLIAQSADDLNSQLKILAHDEFTRPFDLVKGPLLRTRLLRTGPTAHVLLSAMHHIIADGWSLDILLQELTALYSASLRNQLSPLSDLSLTYADYAEWQRDYIDSPAVGKLNTFWREQLAGVSGILDIPADHPRPVRPKFPAAVERFIIGEEIKTKLGALALQSGATLFMTMLAAYAILLSRYTGSEDFLIGTPVANRPRRELEPLIGMFVNTLVLRVDLRGKPSFRELLGRLRRTCLDAFAHQDLPLEKLFDLLQPGLRQGRSNSQTPLFQTMLIVQNQSTISLSLPGLEIAPLALDRVNTQCDLMLFVDETPETLHCALEYSTELFESSTIGRMTQQLSTLIQSITVQPDLCVSSLPLLSKSERNTILTAWAGSSETRYGNASIHGIFEEQVRLRPDSVAVTQDGRTLTYGELNTEANQVANALIEAGVHPDSPVVVCMNRSAQMIIALVGILKAGGAYVAIDPQLPAERRKALIDNAGAHQVITESWFNQLDCKKFNDPNVPVSTNNLAYISFTSGSTGAPKGVAIPHAAVIRLVKATSFVELSEREVILQMAPVSFDASTLEIWGSLLNGGRLVLMPPGQPTLGQIATAIQANEVTTLWLTAGLFHLMVDEQLDSLQHLRQVLAGGDVLSTTHVKRFLQACPNTTLINGYGPTENTTFTACYTMNSDSLIGSTVPIGRPIGGTAVYILDRRLQPVAVGISGELYTSGEGLARGYWKQAALTAATFLPNPFTLTPGERMYRTGDLARWRSDSNIEFLGRADNQLKIRGFRIEPAEIEHALSSHPYVSDCVVIARGESNAKRLAAYVVTRSNTVDATHLRSFLQDKLPDYMIPSDFVLLGSLPLNENSKVDRTALPHPASIPAPEDTGKPASTTEQDLLEIWRDVLGESVTGTGANFFQAGGHSLLAAQLVSRIERKFGTSLTIREIFDYPTIASQAELLDTRQIENATDSELEEILAEVSQSALMQG